MANQKQTLSKGNRSFLVTLLFIVLLIWGPIEPYGLFIRAIYLVGLPTMLWIVLSQTWRIWKFNKSSNDRLSRTIAAVLAGILILSAALSLQSKYHTECDQYARSRDGEECVGNLISVKGADLGGALLEIGLAGFALWYAIAKHEQD